MFRRAQTCYTINLIESHACITNKDTDIVFSEFDKDAVAINCKSNLPDLETVYLKVCPDTASAST